MNDNETTPTRMQRVGKWLNRNAEDVALIALNSAIIGGTIGLVVWAYKADKKAADTYIERINDQLVEQNKQKEAALERGAQVLPTGTGEYWVIENGHTSLI